MSKPFTNVESGENSAKSCDSSRRNVRHNLTLKNDIMFKHVGIVLSCSLVALGPTDNCKFLLLKATVPLPSEYIPFKSAKYCHLIILEGGGSYETESRKEEGMRPQRVELGKRENEGDV